MQALAQALAPEVTLAVAYCHAIPSIINGHEGIAQKLEDSAAVRGHVQRNTGNDVTPCQRTCSRHIGPSPLTSTRSATRCRCFRSPATTLIELRRESDQVQLWLRSIGQIRTRRGWDFAIGPDWLHGMLMAVALARALVQTYSTELNGLTEMVREVSDRDVRVQVSAAVLPATPK